MNYSYNLYVTLIKYIYFILKPIQIEPYTPINKFQFKCALKMEYKIVKRVTSSILIFPKY